MSNDDVDSDDHEMKQPEGWSTSTTEGESDKQVIIEIH
jgi:hypothetical protein